MNGKEIKELIDDLRGCADACNTFTTEYDFQLDDFADWYRKAADALEQVAREVYISIDHKHHKIGIIRKYPEV